MNDIRKDKALRAASLYFDYSFDNPNDYYEEDVNELAYNLDNEYIFRYIMTKQMCEEIACRIGKSYINKADQRRIKTALKILNLLADIAN